MLTVNYVNYRVRFVRQNVNVEYIHRNKTKIAKRIRTTARLEDDKGFCFLEASVTHCHKDKYSRRAGNENAFRKLANKFSGETRPLLLKAFFTNKAVTRTDLEV